MKGRTQRILKNTGIQGDDMEEEGEAKPEKTMKENKGSAKTMKKWNALVAESRQRGLQ